MTTNHDQPYTAFSAYLNLLRSAVHYQCQLARSLLTMRGHLDAFQSGIGGDPVAETSLLSHSANPLDQDALDALAQHTDKLGPRLATALDG